jgi:transcriptional regulator with GAF, ATPase, and Fis domain
MTGRKFDETADVNSVRNEVREPWLVISSAGGVRSIPLPRIPKVTIGRMHSCDIVIDDESVSRQHAVIHNDPQNLRIEDLGSRNKTKVMGRALTRGESAPLPVGGVVEIGYATMFLQIGRPGQSPTSGGPPTTSVPSTRPPSSKGTAIILDPTMQRLYALLDVIAPSPLNVLVFGETGTGKEVFAEAIHHGSARADRPFLRVNCAALSGSLLESELFGHEKGAFTGAAGAKAGLFEAADGGTVFLDEVGELPLETQAKLLRVIERGEVTRLGSVHTKRVDVRYVAATNRDLQIFINEGRFRSDLFFRLNGFAVTLPPLRKRRREIAALARHFLVKAAKGKPFNLGAEAQSALEGYAWPGNVRELKNVVERALVLSGPTGNIEPMHLQLPQTAADESSSHDVLGPNDTIPPGLYPTNQAQWPQPYQGGPPPPMGQPAMTPQHGIPALGYPQQAQHPSGYPMHTPVSPMQPMAAPPAGSADLKAQRESWEKQQILQALERTSGNQKEAAKLLGISRRTLINKIEAYGIARPRKR